MFQYNSIRYRVAACVYAVQLGSLKCVHFLIPPATSCYARLKSTIIIRTHASGYYVGLAPWAWFTLTRRLYIHHCTVSFLWSDNSNPPFYWFSLFSFTSSRVTSSRNIVRRPNCSVLHSNAPFHKNSMCNISR